MALGSDVWVVVYSGGAFCVVVVVHGGVCLWGTLVGSTQHGTPGTAQHAHTRI